MNTPTCVKPTGQHMCAAPATHVLVNVDGWVSTTTWCERHVQEDKPTGYTTATWQRITEEPPAAVKVKPWMQTLNAPQLCEWFAKCTNEATHLEPHPALGEVPACDRCTQIGK